MGTQVPLYKYLHENPSLVIVSKKADEELPTSNHLLIQHMINNRLSGPTVTSLEAGQQLLLYNYGDINDAEEYTWKL